MSPGGIHSLIEKVGSHNSSCIRTKKQNLFDYSFSPFFSNINSIESIDILSIKPRSHSVATWNDEHSQWDFNRRLDSRIVKKYYRNQSREEGKAVRLNSVDSSAFERSSSQRKKMIIGSVIGILILIIIAVIVAMISLLKSTSTETSATTNISWHFLSKKRILFRIDLGHNNDNHLWRR